MINPLDVISKLQVADGVVTDDPGMLLLCILAGSDQTAHTSAVYDGKDNTGFKLLDLYDANYHSLPMPLEQLIPYKEGLYLDTSVPNLSGFFQFLPGHPSDYRRRIPCDVLLPTPWDLQVKTSAADGIITRKPSWLYNLCFSASDGTYNFLSVYNGVDTDGEKKLGLAVYKGYSSNVPFLVPVWCPDGIYLDHTGTENFATVVIAEDPPRKFYKEVHKSKY